MGICARKERRECVPGENKQYIWKQYPGQRVRYNENQHCCSKHCLSYVFSLLSYLRADEANEAMKQKLKKPIMSIKSIGEHDATKQWSTLYNVLFEQYLFLPTKQAEIFVS